MTGGSVMLSVVVPAFNEALRLPGTLDGMREHLDSMEEQYEVIVREDVHPRGRERGETGGLVMEGIEEGRAQGARAGHAEIVPDELEACRSALDRSRPGDLVVLCVDRAAEVWDEIEARRSPVWS